MDAEGISNACRTNVMMNRPVTNTPASEARNSTVVSRGFSSLSLSLSLSLSFFAKRLPRLHSALIYQAERAVPARYLHQVPHGVNESRKFITGAGITRLLA